MINMNNIKRIRTVNMNDRGQIVIPEDVRKGMGIGSGTSLVLIEKDKEIVLRREKDVATSMGNEEQFWQVVSESGLKNAWSEEDEIWNKYYNKVKK